MIPTTTDFQTNMHIIYRDYLIRFPEESERLSRLKHCLDEGFPVHLRSVMEGHVTAATIVLSEDNKQVFLIHHKALNKWILPGGHYDLGEDLWQCAERETKEETGIQISLDPWHKRHSMIPFDIDTHAIPANLAKNEGAHYHFDCRFLFRLQGEVSIVLAQRELLGADWRPVESMLNEPGLCTLPQKIGQLIA